MAEKCVDGQHVAPLSPEREDIRENQATDPTQSHSQATTVLQSCHLWQAPATGSHCPAGHPTWAPLPTTTKKRKKRAKEADGPTARFNPETLREAGVPLGNRVRALCHNVWAQPGMPSSLREADTHREQRGYTATAPREQNVIS